MSDSEGKIEIIGRAVIVGNNKVLLCHTKGAWNTYLPGGHVEFGEPARVALARELEEELGVKSRVRRFLGGIEHAYKRGSETCCEINLVFETLIPSFTGGASPTSCEDYIEFLWADFDSLAEHKLQPSVLCACLPEWLSGRTLEGRWLSSGLFMDGESPMEGKPLK
jgi:8-oxo-dGTP pyrophosphatase MutT (NUDIX family)